MALDEAIKTQNTMAFKPSRCPFKTFEPITGTKRPFILFAHPQCYNYIKLWGS